MIRCSVVPSTVPGTFIELIEAAHSVRRWPAYNIELLLLVSPHGIAQNKVIVRKPRTRKNLRPSKFQVSFQR